MTKKSLELIEVAGKAVDNPLQDAAQEGLTSHQYLNIVISSRAQTGDASSRNCVGVVAPWQPIAGQGCASVNNLCGDSPLF